MLLMSANREGLSTPKQYCFAIALGVQVYSKVIIFAKNEPKRTNQCAVDYLAKMDRELCKTFLKSIPTH